MANGIVAHALELDDVTNESSLHPGVVVWPAAMAAVERAHGTLGDLLAAGVAGYEVVMRVGEAFQCGIPICTWLSPHWRCWCNRRGCSGGQRYWSRC